MHDRISQFRVARMSVFPPYLSGDNARYALTACTVRRGIPNAQILVDGVLPNAPAHPTTEELLELFDSAIRQHMLVR